MIDAVFIICSLLVVLYCLQPVEKVAKVMERPFYMNPKKAVDFGVADKVVDFFYINVYLKSVSYYFQQILRNLSSVCCKDGRELWMFKIMHVVHVLFQRFAISVTYLWCSDRVADIVARSGSYG